MEKTGAHVLARCSTSRKAAVSIIMKDNHTLGNNPENAIRWCQIAREEAERG